MVDKKMREALTKAWKSRYEYVARAMGADTPAKQKKAAEIATEEMLGVAENAAEGKVYKEVLDDFIKKVVEPRATPPPTSDRKEAARRRQDAVDHDYFVQKMTSIKSKARAPRGGSRKHRTSKHRTRKHRTKKHRTRKHMTAKKHHSRRYRKGSKSRTRRGRKDFSTKKSSKVFNRRSRYQRRSSRGMKRRPFSKRQRGGMLLYDPPRSRAQRPRTQRPAVPVAP